MEWWRLAESGVDIYVVGRNVRYQNTILLQSTLPHQTLTECEVGGKRFSLAVGVTPEEFQTTLPSISLGNVEDAVLHFDKGGEFGEDDLGDRHQVLLSLQQPGQLRQVRLQPVLLGVDPRGILQVPDHLVDVVLQIGHLAGSLDGDLLRQVTIGNRSRHLRDRTDLCGQVCCKPVDVVGQVAPGAACTRHVRLSTELPFDTDLTCNRRHLVGKRGKRVDHVVDRPGQLGNLPLRLHRELLLQITLRHRGHHARDAADLRGQVSSHRVDIVGQIFPRSADPLDLRLSTEFPFGPDLARYTGHLACK